MLNYCKNTKPYFKGESYVADKKAIIFNILIDNIAEQECKIDIKKKLLP